MLPCDRHTWKSIQVPNNARINNNLSESKLDLMGINLGRKRLTKQGRRIGVASLVGGKQRMLLSSLLLAERAYGELSALAKLIVAPVEAAEEVVQKC